VSANTDMTDIIQSKAHPFNVKKDILARLEQIKKNNSSAYELYLDKNDGDSQNSKDSFYVSHYLAFDELIHAVQWCVKMTATRP
jgi:hypothetical protein